jgi:hypothetical protein
METKSRKKQGRTSSPLSSGSYPLIDLQESGLDLFSRLLPPSRRKACPEPFLFPLLVGFFTHSPILPAAVVLVIVKIETRRKGQFRIR